MDYTPIKQPEILDDNERFSGNPFLKKAGVKIEFTKEQIEEYIKCSQDVEYFMENYFKITTLDDGIKIISMYDFQKELVRLFNDNRFVIARCARQSGKTIAVEGYILHSILFNPTYRVGIFANKGDVAKKILKEIKFAYEKLPLWMQQGIVEWNVHSIELENGSFIKATTTSEASGRSNTYNLIFMDEFAFVPDHIASDFFEAVYPTISSGKSTKVFIISTPKGLNFFYKMWTDAEEGRSDYVTYLATWADVPGRDEEWRRMTIANVGEQSFAQEYDVDFIGSSNTLISGTKIKSLAWIEPVQNKDHFKVLHEPKSGREYIITVDTARGVENDCSAFVVFDVSEFPIKVAARYQDNTISSLLYPNAIYHASKYYNDAMVLIEVNDLGQQVADILHEDLEFENLIMTEFKGRHGQRVSSGFNAKAMKGLNMSKTVKRIGCANLKTMIETDKLVVEDSEIISEISTFVEKKQSFEAEEGYNDDLVMCLVSFAWLAQQEYFKELTNKDVRKEVKEDSEEDLLETLLPAGFFDEEAERVTVDSQGTRWYDQSYDSENDFDEFSSWNKFY